ncbi:MAG: type II secretion system minor pseudopilin GspK [Desulfobia sp.]
MDCRNDCKKWPGIWSDETGVALVSTLLIAVLVAILATDLISRQEIDIRRTANTIHTDQALVLARAMENWATVLLSRTTKGEELQYLNRTLPPTSVAGGQVTGHIDDCQGFFNINNLILGSREHQEQSRSQFRRLLDFCDMPIELEQKLTDWLHIDLQQCFADGYEESAPPKYMVTASEVRQLKGFSGKSFETCLQPLLRALPEATLININTASARLLASLSDNLDLHTAELLVKSRPEEGYSKVNEFLEQDLLAGTGLQKDFLTVNSSYFMVHSETTIGQGQISLFSLLKKREENIQVLRRSLGVF